MCPRSGLTWRGCWYGYACIVADILAQSHDSGFIEAIPDTISLDALKRGDSRFTTLADFFERHFCNAIPGANEDGSTSRLRRAKMNFVRSLAAYSVISYILQIKDRHNGKRYCATAFRAVHPPARCWCFFVCQHGRT